MMGELLNVNSAYLNKLGFSQAEINAMQCAVRQFGSIKVASLVNYCGVDYEEAQRLKYLYDICCGKVVIDTDDDIAKHFRKMYGKHARIGIQDLQVSKIFDIPRVAVIGGIPQDSPFGIWNSSNYKGRGMLYKVLSVGKSNILLETSRIPALKFKQDKKIDGMLEIKEGPEKGKLKIAVNRNYCRICNRFAIVASLRVPELHCGMVEIICLEGSRVYVFADAVGYNKYTRYGNNSKRVYDYGFFPAEIKDKLVACAKGMYNNLHGVKINTYKANSEYKLIMPGEKVEEDIEDIG